MIAHPLSQPLTKAELVWSLEAESAFHMLKKAVTMAPVLALLDFTKPFMVETDASGLGIGTVQDGHPISFFSKQFCPRLLRSSTYVRELAAITAAVKKWRQYLLGHHFIILTDHRSLKKLMNQAVQTLEQHKYLARLLGFDYVIQYRAGKSNVVADALSRSGVSAPASLFIISVPHFVFLEDLRRELQANPEFTELRKKMIVEPHAYPDHSLAQDLILYRGRIWLPPNCSFIKILLSEFHQSLTGGHMGFRKTLNRVTKNFMWETSTRDTRDFVSNCLECQLVKYEPAKPRGLLYPLPVPSQPWEDLSMDFIVGLPAYRGNTCMLVIVDRFSKGVHLGMLPPHHTSQTVAQLFMEMVGKLHGMPRSITSDRDPLFLSKF